MREIIPDLRKWLAQGITEIAVTTITETRGASLRPAGTRMLLNTLGEVSGSVSSGCVDGDVIAQMEALLRHEDGLFLRTPSIGVSDEQAWGAGLSCGGELDLLVERWTPLHTAFVDEIETRRPVGFASRLDGHPAHLLRRDDGSISGSLGDPELDAAVSADLAAAWPGPFTLQRTYPQGRVFLEVVAPPPTLLIFGATDIAVPLTALARDLDFTVIVNDARRAFLRPERFPAGVDVRFGWPQEVFKPEDFGPGWAIVVLFHDAKFDIPALTLALPSRAFYIGFLGSRRTQADRRATLLENGFSEADLARIYGPTGLDIGGKEPGMIALSILAEIVAVRHRREGGMMSRKKKAIG